MERSRIVRHFHKIRLTFDPFQWTWTVLKTLICGPGDVGLDAVSAKHWNSAFPDVLETLICQCGPGDVRLKALSTSHRNSAFLAVCMLLLHDGRQATAFLVILIVIEVTVRPQLEQEICNVDWKNELAEIKRKIDGRKNSLTRRTTDTYKEWKSLALIPREMRDHTPWLICKIFCFWTSEGIWSASSRAKWYAAGSKTAPTLRLRSEEWIWVAATIFWFGATSSEWLLDGYVDVLTCIKPLFGETHSSCKETQPKNED